MLKSLQINYFPVIDAYSHSGILIFALTIFNFLQKVTLKLLIGILPYLDSITLSNWISLHHPLYSLILLEKIDISDRLLALFHITEATDRRLKHLAFPSVFLL